MKIQKKSLLIFIFLLVMISLTYITLAAVPEGPDSIVNYANDTKPTVSPVMINESQGGGYVYTVHVNATQVADRWKAYVGNVTGKLTLDDATGSTIYDWTSSASLTGYIYATTSSTTVSWTNINCSWAVFNDANNRNVSEYENYRLNHTNADDNITATFASRNHTSFYVGDLQIPDNDCYSIHTYVDVTYIN